MVCPRARQKSRRPTPCGVLLWKQEHGSALDDRGAAYTMLHGLSLELMAEIALECGYPASALKERIYALWDPARLGPAGRFAINRRKPGHPERPRRDGQTLRPHSALGPAAPRDVFERPDLRRPRACLDRR